MNVPHPYVDGAAESWIAGHEPMAELGKQFEFAITLAGTRTPGREQDVMDTGHVVGTISLRLEGIGERRRAELGYWIGVPYWGKGFATEAGHAVIGFGFVRRSLQRIEARYFPVNPASGRVMEKLGMTREGLLRGGAEKNGELRDVVVFGLARAEWLRRGMRKGRETGRLQPA